MQIKFNEEKWQITATLDKKVIESLNQYNYPSLSEDFFERHVEDVNWHYLSQNPKMTINFFERHIKNVNWRQLSANKFQILAWQEFFRH